MVGHYAFGVRSGGSVIIYGAFLLLAGFFLVGDAIVGMKRRLGLHGTVVAHPAPPLFHALTV